MSIDLDSIQEMWEKDSQIDRDNLHEESLNIPSLHAKYFVRLLYYNVGHFYPSCYGYLLT